MADMDETGVAGHGDGGAQVGETALGMLGTDGDWIYNHEDAEGGGDRVRTRLDGIDGRLGGGLADGLTVLGGEPGAGKTAFALQVALTHALAGGRATYVSDEISGVEAHARLLSAVMESRREEGDPDMPPWARLADEAVLRGLGAGQARRLNEAAEKLGELERDGRLAVYEMGQPLHHEAPTGDHDFRDVLTRQRWETDAETGERRRVSHEPGWVDGEWGWYGRHGDHRFRYANMYEPYIDWLGYHHDLIVIDPVNRLRAADSVHSEKYGWVWREVDGERERLERVTADLDRAGRDGLCAILGVYQLNRGSNSYGARSAPSFSDFKGTSQLEYSARAVVELLPDDTMTWERHPRAPRARGNAVGAFFLKVRGGARPRRGDPPAWLDLDGAHNVFREL